jgi:hypothetical protein
MTKELPRNRFVYALANHNRVQSVLRVYWPDIELRDTHFLRALDSSVIALANLEQPRIRLHQKKADMKNIRIFV